MVGTSVAGWYGRGLRLDVGAGRAEGEAIERDVLRDYLGGRGLAAFLLLDRGLWEVDPLSPANALVFAPGPLTGAGAPAAGRFSVSSRSPLTGTVFDGNSGGAFGVALKHLGYDYLWVEGRCEGPSYVVLDAGRGGQAAATAGDLQWATGRRTGAATAAVDGVRVEVRPAGELWGLEVPETLARLRELHPGCEAAVIGPAGERGVLFASIVNNRGRSVGRGGLGAVMGAKNLKAIVLGGVGRLRPPPADAERFAALVREAGGLLRADPVTSRALPEFGTAALVNLLDQAGAFPTRNFRESQFEHAAAISGEALRRDYLKRRSACRDCPVGCARRTSIGAAGGEGPEYETIWALGADCGVGDLDRVLEANYACNRLGIDTISTGSTIACAMELTEEGLLEDGPRFGDDERLAPLARAIAYREGLGDELADGSRRLAERYGRPELAMQVKGLELPAYDPRGMKGQGLAFATSNRGGCHLRANMLGPEILGVPELIDRFATLGKAGLLVDLQDLNAVLDSLVICKFVAFAMKEDYFARLLSAATGETFAPRELLRAGERIWNAERLFNLRVGCTRADDDLPPRLTGEPVAAGPAAGHVVDLQPMLDEYYAARGWDDEGRPRPDKLAGLRVARSAPAEVSADRGKGVRAR
jgi:aldehyde:ferredoxin oxidoreductase